MTTSIKENTSCFIPFNALPTDRTLPDQFTFPFYYDPHPLAILATQQLQDYLTRQTEWTYDFGIENPDSTAAMGKMFGVLVVENEQGEMGFLTAFSGKLLEKEEIGKFVPPIYDKSPSDGFFAIGERELMALTAEIEALENSSELAELRLLVEETEAINKEKIRTLKASNRAAKKVRDLRRKEGKVMLSAIAYQNLEKELAHESVTKTYVLRDTDKILQQQLSIIAQPLKDLEAKIAELRERRKTKSSKLQQRIFEQYQFLNIKGETRDLADIFQDIPIPSGAGECAAPKLLQYAFAHHLKPIAMAEFWWGKSPASAVRYHQNYYPACTGKCKPILVHMLDGMKVAPNPLLTNPAMGKELPTVFEDHHIVIINKPAEFLSVPGKNIFDSVQTRMRTKYPDATGSMMVHRLDMSTSGLLLIAKTKESHKFLQYQFAKRQVKKRYVALLEGIVKEDAGIIDLPLRVDLDNRPHQIICYEHGRKAITKWEVIERKNNQTKVYFYPVTGRTHQLRVHAAHPRGLGCPIIGDDLYGKKADRLHLHAQRLEFIHPVSREVITVEVESDF